MSALMQEMNKMYNPAQMRRRTGSGGDANSPEAFLKSVLNETVRDSPKTPVLSLGGMFGSPQTTPQLRPQMKPLKKPIAIKTIPTTSKAQISPKINYSPSSPYQREGMNMARRYEANVNRANRARCRPQSTPVRRSPPASGNRNMHNNRCNPSRPVSRHRSPNPVPQLSGGKALPHEKVLMLQAWARYHPRKKNFLPQVGMHTGPMTAFQIVKLTMFSPIKFNMDPSDPRYEETKRAIAHINSWILPKSLKAEDTAKYLARAGPRPGHAEDRLLSNRFSQ